MQRRLGLGSFGSCYLVKRMVAPCAGSLFVLKKVSLLGKDNAARMEASREVHLMAQLNSPFVVRYHDCFVEENTLHVVMEYCSEGDLSQLLRRDGPLGEPTVRRFAAHILLGLAHLHERGVVHRDIKGANILLGRLARSPRTRVLKLADFGASRRLTAAAIGKDDEAAGASYRGTVLWMAPEVIRSFGNAAAEGFDAILWEKADVWSVGCTVVEMVTAQSPWALCNDGAGFGNSVAALEHIATTASRPPVPDSLGGECLGLLYRCFLRDPRCRPDISGLLLDPFVAAAVQAERRQHCRLASPRSGASTRRGRSASGAAKNGRNGATKEHLPTRAGRRARLHPRIPVLDFSKLPREPERAATLYKDGVNVAKRIAAGTYVKKKSRSRAQHAFLSALTQGSRSPRSPGNSSLSSIASQISDGEGAPGSRRKRAKEPDAADSLATASWRPTQRRSKGNGKCRGASGAASGRLLSADVFAWPTKAREFGERTAGNNRAFVPLQRSQPDQDGKLFSTVLPQARSDRARARVGTERFLGDIRYATDNDEDTLSVTSALSAASAPTRDRRSRHHGQANWDGDIARPHSSKLVFDFGDGDWRRDNSSGRRSAPPAAVHSLDGDSGAGYAAGSASVTSKPAPNSSVFGLSGLMQMPRSAPVSPATSRTNSRAASPVSQCESGSIPMEFDEERTSNGSDLRTRTSLRRTRSSGSLGGGGGMPQRRTGRHMRRSSRTPSPRNLDPLPHRGAMPLSAARLFVSPASLAQHVTFPPESPPSDEKMRRFARPPAADRGEALTHRPGLPPVQVSSSANDDGAEGRSRHDLRRDGHDRAEEEEEARARRRERKSHRKKHRRRGKRSNRRKRGGASSRRDDATGEPPAPTAADAATAPAPSVGLGGALERSRYDDVGTFGVPAAPSFPPVVEVSETARHILLWWVQTARRHRAEQHARQQRWWQNWWRHRAWTDAYSEAYWHYYWHYYAHYQNDGDTGTTNCELQQPRALGGGGSEGEDTHADWGLHDWQEVQHQQDGDDDGKCGKCYYYSPTRFLPTRA